jgi:sodium-dependent dicarboxylate transporter 2/3/5
MAMAVLLCIIPTSLRGPVDWKGKKQQFLMDWPTIAHGVPWGVVFLFGGGFALAAGMETTGLASWLGGLIASLKGTPVWILFPVGCLFAVVMTEMTSNVATVLMLSPVLAEASVELGVDPYLLMIPTTIMASFAFVLPVATPPNAIVFSSGWITIPKMFRAGLALDLIALVVVPLMVYILGQALFGF